MRAGGQAKPPHVTKSETISKDPPRGLEENSTVKQGHARFEARFEPLQADFKKFIKSQNGFLAGLVFAEAKSARDSGNFTTALELLGELEDLLRQARKRETEAMRQAEKKFKADYKAFERKVRSDTGINRHSALGHARAARRLADGKQFIKANQELGRAKTLLNPPAAPTNSARSKPFTITEIS